MPSFAFWFTGTAVYLAGSFVFAIFVGLIGIKSMISKKRFRVLMVIAVLLSGLAWRTAAKQEEDSAEQSADSRTLRDKISSLQDTVNGLMSANSKIAGQLDVQGGKLTGVAEQNKNLLTNLAKVAAAANVDPNQSAQILADKVIEKISTFQEALNTTNNHITSLEHPKHEQNSIYQSEKVVAKFAGGRISSDKEHLEFTTLYDAAGIDFRFELDFRSIILRCTPHSIDTGMGFIPSAGMVSNIMYNVECQIVSGYP